MLIVKPLTIDSYRWSVAGLYLDRHMIMTMNFCPTEIPDLELGDDLKKTVCLRAGGTLRLFVTVTGRPTPIITWRKKGVDLQSRGFIDTTDSYTSLVVEKVHRYDAGKYIVEAENPSGKRTATVLVKIYGKLCGG